MFCKYSTLGMESMIYDTQVVSTLFDNEDVFKFFGDSAEYIYSIKELENLMKKNFSSQESFINWKDSYRAKRENFLKNYYPNLEKSSEEIIVQTISHNIVK